MKAKLKWGYRFFSIFSFILTILGLLLIILRDWIGPGIDMFIISAAVVYVAGFSFRISLELDEICKEIEAIKKLF